MQYSRHKVGILGGTFDPVHWGHLLIAEAAISQANLKQVIWVPTRHPHYKNATAFEHRWQMAQMAIADNPAFKIAPATVNCTEKSYAVQTLTDLKTLYPNTQWCWIVGLDAFETLPQWYRRQELATECQWLVAPRLPATLKIEQSTAIATHSQLRCEQIVQKLASQGLSINWQILHLPYMGISSSLIRALCRDRLSIRYLVPDAVRLYIEKHRLYSH
ncbi:nicotinate (nicotinamide) nucleotide adenylyltransferase [Gloeocapsopsis crepidinum LEGE 06123]|uniref:Probable nicotinate-nucleotide adenylyltransferase n=1 Tax=Gloeocapsopsis crepidinum LEGE 06123 TaxID=588587 RepID=A0ABR9UWD9_9CHRO|nr:nicotinate (nicotinamide) nucleotide adenylyltransferase [Gloeocapsopsis crepidinum]MBE9191633.1 nicotinate (nicotinamide) nucleotide adenylyltransferase [Gloeocapsopsis crepidinum LEGE 06123]